RRRADAARTDDRNCERGSRKPREDHELARIEATERSAERQRLDKPRVGEAGRHREEESMPRDLPPVVREGDEIELSWPAGADAWRYDPLPVGMFALGESPFRVRGLAYSTLLEYVQRYLPGGMEALVPPSDPHSPYYRQLFLVAGDYDISPLLNLY